MSCGGCDWPRSMLQLAERAGGRLAQRGERSTPSAGGEQHRGEAQRGTAVVTAVVTDKRRFVRKHNGRRREEASLVRLGWVRGGQFKIRGKKAAMSEKAANRFFLFPCKWENGGRPVHVACCQRLKPKQLPVFTKSAAFCLPEVQPQQTESVRCR